MLLAIAIWCAAVVRWKIICDFWVIVFKTLYQNLRSLGRSSSRLELINRSASLSFYTMISVFPMIIVLVSVTTQFFPQARLEHKLLEILNETLPFEAPLVVNNIKSLFHKKFGLSGFGLVALVISSQLLYVNFEKVINVILHSGRSRNFFQTRLISFVWLMAMLLILFSPVLVDMVGYMFRSVGLPLPVLSWLKLRTGYLLSGFLMFLVILLLMPTRRVNMKRVILGGIFFTVALQLGKSLFKFFVQGNLSRYDLVYGSLSSLMIVMLWVFYFYNLLLITVYWAGRRSDSLEQA